jgi:hypothetical protein
LKDSFAGLEKAVKMMNRKIKSLESHQLDLYDEVGPFFETKLYEKLAINPSGILRFTEPIPIAIPTPTEEGFNNIAHAILGDWTIVKKEVINHERRKIDQVLLDPLSKFIDTNLTLHAQHIDELYYRYPIDAIGIGKTIYIVKYLNFKQTAQTLERKVMRLLFLVEAMQKQYKTSIKTFIIGTTPPQRSRSKTYIYNLIVNHAHLQFVQTEDILQILKFLQAENIQKI